MIQSTVLSELQESDQDDVSVMVHPV